MTLSPSDLLILLNPQIRFADSGDPGFLPLLGSLLDHVEPDRTFMSLFTDPLCDIPDLGPIPEVYDNLNLSLVFLSETTGLSPALLDEIARRRVRRVVLAGFLPVGRYDAIGLSLVDVEAVVLTRFCRWIEDEEHETSSIWLAQQGYRLV